MADIIHILLGKANPNTMNGVNKVVHNLATEQLNLGFCTEVWCISNNPTVHHNHTYTIKIFKKRSMRFLLSPELKKAIQKQSNETIYHLHSVFIPELFSVAKFLKATGLRWVHTPHGQYIPESLKSHKWRKKIYIALFERLLVQNAQCVQAIGASEIAAIQKIAPENEVVLIPNGQIETSIFSKKSSTEDLTFVYCGRLAIEQKGLDLLITGFELYKQKGGTGKLCLIGDGADKNKIHRLVAACDYQDDIELSGPLFGDEKIDRLINCNVFLHPSRWDVIPTASLEAASLGLPLLISHETNLGDYVTKYNAGYVLDELSHQNIAELMKKFEMIYRTGELSIQKRAAQKMINGEFSWKIITPRIVKDLYKKEIGQ